MENLLIRYRNVSLLVALLFAQVLGLAVQVRRSPRSESTRLIRVWAVAAVTPLEKAIVWVQDSTGRTWRNYIYLRGVRQENRDLKYQIESLRLQQVRLTEDAGQARRLQALLGFKEQFIKKTVAAQVIGSTGSEQSRGVYIDKGSDDGVSKDMPVITAEGVVGRVLQVFNGTSFVLLINDQTSGVGAIIEKSRLQGILQGTPSGGVVLRKVLADEQVQLGDVVLTSGGDQIFPKGLPAGVVSSVSAGPDSSLIIQVRPSADLSKLEEVLVITEKETRVPQAGADSGMRAVDILARRLPSVPDNASATGAANATGIPLPMSNQPAPAASLPGTVVYPADPGNGSATTPRAGAAIHRTSPAAASPGEHRAPAQTKPVGATAPVAPAAKIPHSDADRKTPVQPTPPPAQPTPNEDKPQ